MKREEKSALSRQRILEAAIGEFSKKGYEGASLNGFCAQHGISKGIVYHHFKDKNELYLLCVSRCFEELTACLAAALKEAEGSVEERTDLFYKAWLHFFGEHPWYLGIFSEAAFRAPGALARQIDECRREYDALYAAMLTDLLEGKKLRNNLDLAYLAGEFQIYMDLFNTRFMTRASGNWQLVIGEHETRCHQQMDILFNGILA